MDLDGILKQLYAGLARVNESIAALERIGSHGPKRPGRPPESIEELKIPRKSAARKSAAKSRSKKRRKGPGQLEETA